MESVRFVRPGAGPSGPVGAAPDGQAKAICDDVRDNVLGADAKAFGAELGRMMAFRAQQDRAAEQRAQQAATAKLAEIAGKLRTHAAQAGDPRLRTALNASAGNLDRLGADTGALTGLDSLDAVSKTTGKFAAALGDVADYCSG
ncbi:hypothetical protein HC031_18355 [Planosporangium thailandense]|uniref:Uncharacterized protein n=1 Tax=Planosporangium thailandense TaxID=765197 RepID=A0ABX0Y2L3_9ACTN|nr:hypothetical protein [Planosporangium thailandense]NJC71667.1 hypothetical protein [Planosporangium thailandense]